MCNIIIIIITNDHKKILSLAASIISIFILQLYFLNNSNSEENNSKYYSGDNGVLSIMYHRFNENKYPSTNIKMNIFKEQMKIIKQLGYNFSNPKFFINEFDKPKNIKRSWLPLMMLLNHFTLKHGLT